MHKRTGTRTKSAVFFIFLFILGYASVSFTYKYFISSLRETYGSQLLGSSTTSQGTTLNPKEGYSYVTVKTNVGTFGAYVYKADLSKYMVKTVSTIRENCRNNCPTKPLKQFITENNAVAGMNAGYFCPPDYPSCKGKVNSFDFAFYNSNRKVWLNKKSLTWFKTAIATFKGNTAKFCMDTSKCSTSGVTAAVSNFPALVQDGKIVVEKGDVQPYQRRKDLKGAIGYDGKNVYLVQMPGASITDAAYITRALGMTYSMTLDGGGTAALYANGVYKLGPGRLLPTAVVIVKR